MTSICITHRPSAVELVTSHIIANSTLLASITDEISFHRMTPCSRAGTRSRQVGYET